MNSRNRADLRPIFGLLLAVLITATVVTGGRFLWLEFTSSAIVPLPDQLSSFLGLIAIFTIGGLPAAALCWGFARGQRANRVRIGGDVWAAAISNGILLLIALWPLYILTWSWIQAIALAVSLAGVGSVAFFFVLRTSERFGSTHL